MLLSLLGTVASGGELPSKVTECTSFIILFAQVFITKHGVSFVNLLEALLEALVAIGVVPFREGVVRILDFFK